MTRKPTPDLLSDILSANPEGVPEKAAPSGIPSPSKQQDVKDLRQNDSKTVRHHNSKEARSVAGNSEKSRAQDQLAGGELNSASKIKATFYLSPELIEEIDQSRLQLRRMTLPAKRGAVSKSLVIEAALHLALQELNAKLENSKLAQEVAATLNGVS